MYTFHQSKLVLNMMDNNGIRKKQLGVSKRNTVYVSIMVLR